MLQYAMKFFFLSQHRDYHPHHMTYGRQAPPTIREDYYDYSMGYHHTEDVHSQQAYHATAYSQHTPPLAGPPQGGPPPPPPRHEEINLPSPDQSLYEYYNKPLHRLDLVLP